MEQIETDQVVHNWRDNHNKNAAIMLTFIVMMIAKIITLMLPKKYFFDNNRILGMANGDDSVKAWGGSYEVAANFFKTVNVFNFVKMTDWSWFLGLLMTGIILLVITRIDEPDLPQLVFLLACVGLLNIYVFNIGKDVIQFLFFFAVYLVIISPIGNTTVKLLISSLILYFESTVFRAYYILIAALAIAVYCILRLFHRFVNLPRVVRLLGILLSMYVLVCAVMFVARVAKPDEFQLIMSVRDASLAGRDADTEASVTIIQNWIGGDSASSGNLPLFLVNYGINAARMLVPVELLTKACSIFHSCFSSWRLRYIWPVCLFMSMRSRMKTSSSHCPFSWVISSRQLFSNPISARGCGTNQRLSRCSIYW
mgnify:FL=1